MRAEIGKVRHRKHQLAGQYERLVRRKARQAWSVCGQELRFRWRQLRFQRSHLFQKLIGALGFRSVHAAYGEAHMDHHIVAQVQPREQSPGKPGARSRRTARGPHASHPAFEFLGFSLVLQGTRQLLPSQYSTGRLQRSVTCDTPQSDARAAWAQQRGSLSRLGKLTLSPREKKSRCTDVRSLRRLAGRRAYTTDRSS